MMIEPCVVSLGSMGIYPGGLRDWELLWIQNVLLTFVQFSTGAALYSQDTRYATYLTAFARSLLRRDGRDLLLVIHAATGLLLVVVNFVFAGRWFLAQPTTPITTLFVRPDIAVTTALLTLGMLTMAFTGVSLYAHARPDTAMPVWRFEYAVSRKIHRAVFSFVVAILGYHVFVTPRTYLMWQGWIRSGEFFGVLVLGTIVLWGLLAGQSVVMIAEWLTGRPFSKWDTDWSSTAGGIGALAALTYSVGISFLSIPIALMSVIGVLVALGSIVLVVTR